MAPTQAAATTPPDPITIPTPVSLTSTTPNLPSSTQQALIAHLRTTQALPELATLLADSLARTGWTDRVRALALELLRNGSCDTFPELLEEVTRRAKIPKSDSGGGGATGGKTLNGVPASSAASTNGATATTTNGSTGAIAVSKEWSGGPDGLPDVRIPEVTVDAGVEFLKEQIKEVVEPVDDDNDEDDDDDDDDSD